MKNRKYYRVFIDNFFVGSINESEDGNFYGTVFNPCFHSHHKTKTNDLEDMKKKFYGFFSINTHLNFIEKSDPRMKLFSEAFHTQCEKFGEGQ